MIDKKLILILILLFIYSVFINPLNQQIEIKKEKLNLIIKRIKKEKFIFRQSQKINKLYPICQEIIKVNRSLFFGKDTTLTQDKTELQEFLKSCMRKSGMQLMRLNWAESVDKGWYEKLPLSFTARGNQNKIQDFLKCIISKEKLIKFEQLSISKFWKKDTVSINGVIVGFKLKND